MRPQLLVRLPGWFHRRAYLSAFLLVCALVDTEQMELELEVNTLCY